MYFHSWRCLLIVDLDLLKSILDLVMQLCYEAIVVQLFFLTMEIILSSCTLVFFCGLSGLLVLLSWSVRYFLGMYQIADLATPKVFALSDKFTLVFSLIMSSPTCINYLFWPNFESSSEQLPNASLTFGVGSRSLICWICHEIMKEQASPDHQPQWWAEHIILLEVINLNSLGINEFIFDKVFHFAKYHTLVVKYCTCKINIFLKYETEV